MASLDGYKVKKQPERKQCLCPSVSRRSVSDTELQTEFSFIVECGSGMARQGTPVMLEP